MATSRRQVAQLKGDSTTAKQTHHDKLARHLWKRFLSLVTSIPVSTQWTACVSFFVLIRMKTKEWIRNVQTPRAVTVKEHNVY